MCIINVIKGDESETDEICNDEGPGRIGTEHILETMAEIGTDFSKSESRSFVESSSTSSFYSSSNVPWSDLSSGDNISFDFIHGYGARHMQPHSHFLSCRYDYYRDVELRYICLVEDDIETFKIINIFLLNPSIGKSFGIDLSGYDLQTLNRTSYGFGVCPVTSDLTVVKFVCKDNMPWHVEVFRLSSEVWNVIPSGNLPRQTVTIITSTQVVIDKFIFWGAREKTNANHGGFTINHMVVSFDLITKEFKVVNLRDTLTNKLFSGVSISKLRGSLVVCGYIVAEEAISGVWVMEITLENYSQLLHHFNSARLLDLFPSHFIASSCSKYSKIMSMIYHPGHHRNWGNALGRDSGVFGSTDSRFDKQDEITIVNEVVNNVNTMGKEISTDNNKDETVPNEKVRKSYANVASKSGMYENNKLLFVPTVMNELGKEVGLFDEELVSIGSKKRMWNRKWLFKNKIAMITGEEWKNMTEKQKAPFEKVAKQNEKYTQEMEIYKQNKEEEAENAKKEEEELFKVLKQEALQLLKKKEKTETIIKVCVSNSDVIVQFPMKKKNKKVVDPNKPKRPTYSFFIFSKETRRELSKEKPGISNAQVTALNSVKWKELSEEEKQKWNAEAAQAMEAYKNELEEYKNAVEITENDN
uniref:High mobility group B protein 6-like isoform X2 n=1 Tax=Tanacetum cinerariifolium TaxID=118510 RepID=A0A6L2LTH4_TANCI|nr:high mobility group B protein 6-like isoform X2 [Tanacetum cinerariifolium]